MKKSILSLEGVEEFLFRIKFLALAVLLLMLQSCSVDSLLEEEQAMKEQQDLEQRMGPCQPSLGFIDGSNSIHCTNSVTYTLYGVTAISWTVSTNLTIVSSTSTSITVVRNNAPQPAETFIQANLANGQMIKKVVTVAGPPTPPNGNYPVMWGPSLLKSYQVEDFEVPVGTNYLTAQWSIWSSTMGNVSHYFEISPAYPMSPPYLLVFVKVLPTAPAGQYTIICKVSNNNNCGDLFIEKTFNVELGPPTMFEPL